MRSGLTHRGRISRELVTAGAATAFLVVLSLAFGGTPSLAGHDTRPAVRLAYFPNLTHAPALVGMANGEFQRHLPGYRIDPKVVNAGPEAMEALLAGEIDLAYVGPSPAVNTYLKSNGKALVILAGACSGGASLIARPEAGISSVADLGGKKVAVPQLGGTQDVSLRHFMDDAGLAPTELGGTVQVIPAKNPDILALLLSKQIDAAWVPEPWASRLRHDAKAVTVVDERSLWPEGKFTTTVLVARRDFASRHPDLIKGFLEAHVSTVDWIGKHPSEAKGLVNNQLAKLTGKPLSRQVIDDAWQRLSFTTDANEKNIEAFAQAAEKAGYLKGNIEISGAFEE